jgi:MoxR-like ATPase
MQPSEFSDPTAVAEALDRAGYLPDTGVATAAYLAMRMGRPLFLEGDPGVGKTALAQALADITGARLVRLQCYEGIDASQALYDWDFPRQILHLRAAGESADTAQLEASLYDRRFLVARPILQAIEHSPSVLLIDEIDRADDEFEAFLLEVLADNAVSIPELGTIRAETPPIVVLTSNRTREVHDALKRRCLYTGWPTRSSSARSRSSGAAYPASLTSWRATSQPPWGCCARRTCSSHQGSLRRSTGRRRCTCSGPATWTPTARPPPSALR